MSGVPIGRRIAAYRRRKGLSQAALAGLVGRSESWLSQVERGLRDVDRLSVLTDLARVLDVPLDVLSAFPPGRAAASGPADPLQHVRAFFMGHPGLLATTDHRRATPEPDLGTSVAAAHRDYQAARYEVVIAGLPALLAEAERTRRPERRRTQGAIASAYILAAKLLTKLGATDLAVLAADRGATAAASTESLACRGAAAYQVVTALGAAGRSAEAEEMAVRMAEHLEVAGGLGSPEVVSVTGALWLESAVIASRRNAVSPAVARLRSAQRLAELLGHDGNHVWTAFGPTNVAIHRLAVSTNLGDPTAALRAAEKLDVGGLPHTLRSRRAQVHLDLARARMRRREPADALLHLLQAEAVAPQSIRYAAATRELIEALLERRTRSTAASVDGLARRAGLMP
jgi:transcriptional regulator with XRE-family HTH domain